MNSKEKKNIMCAMVHFNGSSFGTHKKFLQDNEGSPDAYTETEHIKREQQQAEEAWNQLRGRREAPEEAVQKTEKEKNEAEVGKEEKEWSMHVSGCLLESATAWQV